MSSQDSHSQLNYKWSGEEGIWEKMCGQVTEEACASAAFSKTGEEEQTHVCCVVFVSYFATWYVALANSQLSRGQVRCDLSL